MYIYLLCFLCVFATCSYSYFKEKENKSIYYKGLIFKHYSNRRRDGFIYNSFSKIKKKLLKVKKYSFSKRCKSREAADFHFRCSLESPIVGLKVQEKLKGTKKKEKLWNNKISFVHFNLDKFNFKLKEDFLRKDRKKLNNFLCLYYIPSVTSYLLKHLLSRLSLQDSIIKETIMYHLILKYFYVNFGKYEEKILNIIGKKHYQFIREHARDLKKNIQKKKKQLESYNNKILDIYCKLQKKENVIMDSIKIAKKNVKQVFTKVKRNIIYYGFFDRILIFHYLYQKSQYRLILLFFKKFLFKHLNENNLFIINFINKLNEKIIWNSNSYNKFWLYSSFCVPSDSIINNKLNTEVERTTKGVFLVPNEPNEFIELYIRNKIYFKNWEYSTNECDSNGIQNNYNYLLYIYLLNSLLAKRNHYYVDQFLHQFFSYYTENHFFKDDVKNTYFLITLGYSMKQFYLKKKYDILEEEEKLVQQIHPLFNYIKIYNENLFDKNKKYEFQNLSKLNNSLLSYIKRFINLCISFPNSSSPSTYNVCFDRTDKTYLMKSFAVLLFLQHVCLLETNLKNDFLNKRIPNFFANKSEKNFKRGEKEKEGEKERIEEKEKGGEKNEEEKEKGGEKNEEEKEKEGEKNEEAQLFHVIINIYVDILEHSYPTFPFYLVFFDELYFFIKHYTDDILNGSLKKKEILLEFLKNRNCIFRLSKVNPTFVILILSVLNILNENKFIERIIKENGNFVENIDRETINVILKNCKKGNNIKNEYFLDRLLIESQNMNNIYKNVVTSRNPKKVKSIVSHLIQTRKKNKRKYIFFRKEIFTLNLEQIYFFFIHLNRMNLDREIVHLFDFMLEDALFKRKFNKLIKERTANMEEVGREQQKHIQCARNIRLLYYMSLLRLKPHSFFLPCQNLKKEFPVLCFHRDPFYIFLFLIEKYASHTKKKDEENSEQFEKQEQFKKKENLYPKLYPKLYSKLNTVPKEIVDVLVTNNNNKILSRIITIFFFKKIYALLSEEEYTLIFYVLMKYLFKRRTSIEYNLLNKEKESLKKNKIPKHKLVYFLFCYTYFCYRKIYKISQINFLIVAKAFLISRDVSIFRIFCEENKKLIENNFTLFNSLLNKYFDSSNMKQFGKWKCSECFLSVPVFMYVLNNKKMIIYYLNNNEIVNTINAIKNQNKTKIKIYFFLDFRKISVCLMNVHSFFNLHFLKNEQFQNFITENDIPLNSANIYNMSEFVIFFGNNMDKRKHIKKYIRSNYKTFLIKKKKIIKDALVISIKD